MAAANTDLFRKVARRYVSQVGSGGIADGSATTGPLSSVSGLPTDTAVDITFDRVDTDGNATSSAEETVTGVVSGSNLTDMVRAQEGTAQAHTAGKVAENLWSSITWNDAVDGILVNHSQLGYHKSLSDTNGNEWIKQTATSSAVNELTIANAATGNAPVISATGDNTDVGIKLTPKGAGEVEVTANDVNLSGTTPNIQVGGADPWRTISIFGGMKPTTTAPCADKTTLEAATNDIDYDVLDFDASSDENAFVNFQMPDSYNGGVIQFRYVWTNASGSSAQTVVFELSGRSFANDDAIDQAVGTPVEVSDTWIAQGDIHISAWSGDVTLAGSPAGGQWVHFEVMRDVSEDDLTGDARLMDVQIRYKQAQFSD